MKINGKQEVLGKIARLGLLLAALLGMVLSCAVTGQAQATAIPASAQDVKPAAAIAAPTQTIPAIAKPAGAQAKASTLPEEKSPVNAAKDGIVVHGHWTIVVKNPDGSIAARQELENTLDPNEGADLLTGLLAGTYTTDGFLVSLYSADLICGTGICEIPDSRVQSVCGQLGYPTCGTLTYSAKSLTATTNAVGFTLSGTVTLLPTDGGTITGVSTGVLGCIPASTVTNSQNQSFVDGQSFLTNATLSSSFGNYPPGQYLSGAACRGNGPTATPPFISVKLLLTSRAISQRVTGGQSVAVTVVITFSGS